MIRKLALLPCVLLAIALYASSATSAEWGSLSGRFIYGGAPPMPPKIDVNKDVEVCGKTGLVDESLLVGAGGELANGLVYLRTKDVPVHPGYAATAKANVDLDNKNCRFSPHIAILRTTQSLVLKNTDPIGHNVKVDPVLNVPSNVLIPAGGEASQTMATEESLPVKVGCNIHPWMGGWVLVRNNPYAAVSGQDGKFEIKDLPAGQELEFQFWQEKSGYLKDAAFKGGKADTRGRFKLTLKPGVNDLGDVKLSPVLFAK